jgi:hypothetical protein
MSSTPNVPQPTSPPNSKNNRSLMTTSHSVANNIQAGSGETVVSMASSVRLNGKYTPDIATTGVTTVGVTTLSHTTQVGGQASSMVVKSNTIAAIQQQANGGPAVNGETDSGRASMASNVEQDQCSPMFQQRAFILNKCELPNFIENAKIDQVIKVFF